jgi:hypothetical protein
MNDQIRNDADQGHPSNCHRRDALRLGALGFGWLALQGMLAESSLARTSFARGAQDGAPLDPLAPRAGHHAARAKRVIFLNMSGAPSHVDTFDHKSALKRDDGKTISGQFRQGAKLLASPWEFHPSGKSGLMISSLLPNLAKQADKLCLLRGMQTEVPAHPQAQLKLHTGSFQFVRPSLGAWTLYGLGTTNRNLPGFVTINPPGGSAQQHGSAFLPATFQGMPVAGAGRVARAASEPVANTANARLDRDAQRKQLDLLQKLNREHLKREQGDDQVEGVIESYELAFRMQSELPALLDLSKEKRETLAAYGVGGEDTDAFGRQCLMARHLAEAGVRFVQIHQGGWDHHRNLRNDLAESCRKIDQPVAALLADLEQRGLLADTLVVWSGEFGRTPYAQGVDGRDHNHKGFTAWMAGGGVKGGHSHGATDEHGIEAVEGRMQIHDLHATILHLLGLDHERLTYNHAGRDFRLTDVHGEVAKEIFA